uniref:Uncharacterized protein n=1 Tax=Mycena chlorophos TaxID=658473 RepID=A0ABQ0M2U1_MYCCL|nr:predicted protein [Mycena chlorophos]
MLVSRDSGQVRRHFRPRGDNPVLDTYPVASPDDGFIISEAEVQIICLSDAEWNNQARIAAYDRRIQCEHRFLWDMQVSDPSYSHGWTFQAGLWKADIHPRRLGSRVHKYEVMFTTCPAPKLSGLVAVMLVKTHRGADPECRVWINEELDWWETNMDDAHEANGEYEVVFAMLAGIVKQNYPRNAEFY